MDNLGDWLYILILIAAGIGSLFSSAKKKKQAEQQPPQPTLHPEHDETKTQKPKSFWEILEEEMKRGSVPQGQPQPTPQPIKAENRKKTQKKSSVPTPSFAEGEKAIKDHRLSSTLSSSIETQEDETYSISVESFQNTDELKKAIIYSEILNRKY